MNTITIRYVDELEQAMAAVKAENARLREQVRRLVEAWPASVMMGSRRLYASNPFASKQAAVFAIAGIAPAEAGEGSHES